MDPGRAAMISGTKSPTGRDRDITAPRRDTNNRITKPSWERRPPNTTSTAGTTTRNAKSGGGGGNNYMTEEQLSEKFVAEEDKFVLRQSKKKADIRVRERRAKPIDFLAFHLRFVDSDRDVFDDEPTDVETDVPGPEAVLESANAEQLAELEADIRSFHTLEQNGANRAYWQAMLVLCREQRELVGGPQGGEARLLSTVAGDIDRILRPKALVQLEALEASIRAKLRSDEAIDTDYWEQLLRRLQVWKARAAVKKTGAAVRTARATLLRERDPAKAEAVEKGLPVASAGETVRSEEETVAADDDMAGGIGAGLDDDENENGTAAPPGTARFAAVSGEDFSQATKALYDREVARGVRENEEIFAAEEVVPSAGKPKWADKYRPRKPRYFNRVQMGYEWNKYNQTHYDHDNPPPKVVQGYKFNIFYPELIDKTKAPTYHIIREGGRRRGESFAPAGEEDTCLIRFSAGPPYDDIAFRIVDREWDYSAKRERGFKSSFEKGILQLHFQFKKIWDGGKRELHTDSGLTTTPANGTARQGHNGAETCDSRTKIAMEEA
ncbi:hypothetical protein CMQ_6212 [Grosmannia clavigera kw1407]|uniref:Splicing factor Cactin n=1 Tax=Grosmannia clavigera (strain kw1407 / UAMH 11150) TaxID=655863 RepID=F0XMP7_GROCL|nr:uncharacterized protein CMQ_6212 [Grosmannia clavigera kw1407]EFX01270.1 hypothetical protein CMQ_6212 [Grosmannia clavigera kw1407]